MRSTIEKMTERVRETPKQWVSYLPFWIAAVLVSLLSVGFAKLFVISEDIARHWVMDRPEIIFILAPLGFILSWAIVEFFSEGSAGSGIPQLIAAIDVTKKHENSVGVRRLVSLRVVVAKIAGTLVSILGGASTGREGPTLQLAAAVFDEVSRFSQKFIEGQAKLVHRQFILLAGGAAGLAAAFNTPLGGVVFAIEELSKDHVQKFRSILLQAVLIAGVGAQALAGSYLYLGKIYLAPMTLAMVIPVIVAGALAGFIASLSTETVLAMIQLRGSRKSRSGRLTVVLICALVFAALVYVTGPATMGSGRTLMEHYLIAGDTPNVWLEAIGRIVGNVISFGSGIVGGIFAPALSSGATIGALLSHVFTFVPFTVLVTAGMAGFLSGVTRTPFTSAVLIAEMTGSGSEIITFMLAAFAGQIAAKAFGEKSFYERASLRFVALAERGEHETNKSVAAPVKS